MINTNQDIPGETWDNDKKIRKTLDILKSYPNEFWKYPVVIYYLSHRNKDNFDERFLLFLNKLAGELMTRFILHPTINVVKADIMKLNAKIINDIQPEFMFRNIDGDKSELKKKIILPHRNIVRMLLKTYAYSHQEDLLPDNWQIEHILPQRWQTTFFPDMDDSIVNEMIEHIGNKTAFERKLNIIASNGYFGKKQEEYRKSNVEITKILVTSVDSDWTIGNIKHRDELVSSEIIQLFETWSNDYSLKKDKTQPSAEDLAKIEEFKQKGWI